MFESNQVVLITNVKKPPTPGYKKHMLPDDVVMRFTRLLLKRAIISNGYKVVEYSLKDFVKNIDLHVDDLVFPYHHGLNSKIRESIIQTYCENSKIKYIGGDAHTQTVGNDKALAKELCRQFGILTPTAKILFHKDYPPDIEVLKLPLIVKPRFEGGSIGINDRNVVYNYSDAINLAKELLEDLQQPILIEEYIKGEEISVCIVGYNRIIKKIGIVKYNKSGLVKSYNDKYLKLGSTKFEKADSLLDEQLREQCVSLFHSLDKIEFVRFDFIRCMGVFYNIEITVSPTLSPLSCMFAPFKNEMTFNQFIGLLISNCKERYRVLEGS